ncbi:MAG: hypothetical protein JSV39_02010, partial [Candidatus Aenigmatarchaeota archaeon]
MGGSGDCTGNECLTACCGDDDGEKYRTEDTYSNAIAFDDDEYTCCNEGSDCVAGGYCFDSQSAGTTNCGLNLGGNDNCSHCYNNGGVGEWLECDQSDYMDYWCGNICGPKMGVKSPRDPGNPDINWNAMPAGESGVGEYPDTTTIGCCGDDTGEEYRYCEGSSSFPDTGDCTSDDKACCNLADDCVTADGTTCIETLTTSVDADGDGDDDYCNSGTWYECNTDIQCPVGYVCSSNDCVACTANDCADHSNCWDGTAGCCDEHSDCTADDDDFCQNYTSGDENAKTNPAGDSDTEAGNIELASLHVCAPAKHLDWGTEASNTDGFCLNTKYSRTQTYRQDEPCPSYRSDWWQFSGDSMLTAQTSYTTSDTDLCFAYVYEPCTGSN